MWNTFLDESFVHTHRTSSAAHTHPQTLRPSSVPTEGLDGRPVSFHSSADGWTRVTGVLVMLTPDSR